MINEVDKLIDLWRSSIVVLSVIASLVDSTAPTVSNNSTADETSSVMFSSSRLQQQQPQSHHALLDDTGTGIAKIVETATSSTGRTSFI